MNRTWAMGGTLGRWLLAVGFFSVASLVLIIPLIVGVLWSLVNPDVGWFPPAIVPSSLSLANWRAMLAVPEIGQAFVMSFLIAPIVTPSSVKKLLSFWTRIVASARRMDSSKGISLFSARRCAAVGSRRGCAAVAALRAA